ncbi:MAG: Type 1 glutamine amidotransferase-like domain-containing protein [Ignavibacteriales bacterium]|nr:Type 1 glutamine amidotransferase-like domain-containing protein [Ignavibacteriales bacterium]
MPKKINSLFGVFSKISKTTKYFIFLLCLSQSNFPQGYICAVGGGSEDYNDWSDKPYGWIVEKSDSGKIIILGVDDATTWLPDYFKFLGAKEVYNKKISSRTSADLQSTYDELITAKAIFLRGGDQYDYVRLWKGTKTETAIKYVFQNGGVIAGTSAGAAVLGDFGFSAKYGSVDSKECLANPFSSKIDLEDNFIDLVPNVLFDTHFIERGRFGRLIAFLINLHQKQRDVLGIGVDDMTAFCIDKNGIGEVMGSGAVSIFQIDEATRFSGNTVNNLKSHQLVEGWSYDLKKMEVEEIPPSAKAVDSSRAIQLPKQIMWLTGTNDLQLNLANGFNHLLFIYGPKKTLLFYDPKSSSGITPLFNFFAQNGFTVYDTLEVSARTANYNVSVEKILNADLYVFLGTSPSAFQVLIDTTTIMGYHLHQKIITQGSFWYFIGNTGKLAGEYYIDNTDDNYLSSYHGQMTIKNGLNLFGDLIFQPLLFDDSDYYENRSSSLLYGMMRNRKQVGIYLSDGNYVNLLSGFCRTNHSFELPFICVSAKNTTYVDSSKYVAGSGYKPRQVVAMNNLRYTISNERCVYILDNGELFITSVVKEDNEKQGPFILNNNFPNPFNNSTKISYTLPTDSKVLIELFNLLGERIYILRNQYDAAGFHTLDFDGKELSSGVYFYKLTAGSFSQIKKMIFLK